MAITIFCDFMNTFLVSAQNSEKGQDLVASQTCFVQDLLCTYNIKHTKSHNTSANSEKQTTKG